MALLHSFENSGNWLFKRRGQIPVFLFLMAIPAVYFARFNYVNHWMNHFINYFAVLLSVLGFVVRAYTIGTTPRGTSGRNTENQVAESLNTSGIYSVVRHPLYLGNYLMWIGIVVYTHNISFVIIVSLMYWLYYERIMFAEERFLERKFGQTYLDWSLQVPAFLPKWSSFRKSTIPFSLKSVLRREYSGVLATVIGFVYVEILMGWFRYQTFTIGNKFIYVLIASVVITLVLRTLKHNTKILSEEGRS
ncbi:MAG TPA: isoprenylcysteine carboxylmethyltransferase family protein [Bacteroidia bacterium]|nr:isoprenylcysteine carboxylmethyltransferase family protein [Bacteroidia bacterium]